MAGISDGTLAGTLEDNGMVEDTLVGLLDGTYPYEGTLDVAWTDGDGRLVGGTLEVVGTMDDDTLVGEGT